MSEINRENYPKRASSLENLSLTIRMSEIPDQTYDEWDTSIAISESMSEFAPFNCINYLTVTPNSGPLVNEFKKFVVQKIALYYLSSTVNKSGNSNRYYNGSIESMFMGRAYEYNAVIYGGRYAPRGWTAQSNFARYYHPENYYLIDGMKIQNVVCVICVLFTDNSYCSLKWYNDNKQTISKTPMSLFMIGIYGDNNTNTKQNFCPINMMKNTIDYWTNNNGNLAHGTTEAPLKYPLGAGTLNAFGDNYGIAESPSDVFPLVACIQGTMPLSKSNWWISSIVISSVFIVGGAPNKHYTIADTAKFNPVLSQKAFDEVHSIAATYGLPFRDDFPTDIHNVSSGGTVFMPIANDGGYFDGRFEVLSVNGTVSSELSVQNLELWNGDVNTIFNNRNYDPDIPISTDIIDLVQPTLTPIDCFNKSYILNRDDVEQLADILWTHDQTIIDQMIELFKNWHAGDALNGIINLMLFPFDVRSKTGATENEPIVIGKYVTPIRTYRLGDTPSARYSLGSFKWNNEFGNTFLDYSPYTEAELYIPYFGTIPLSPEHFLNKEISIDLVVDFVSGAATVIVFVKERDAKHPVIYKNGNIAVQIPLSSNRSMEQQKQVVQNALSFGGGLKTRLENMMGGGRAEPSGTEQMPNLLDGNGQLRLTGPVQPQGETNLAVSAAKLGTTAAMASPQAKIAMMAGQAIMSMLPTFSSPSVFNEAGSATPDCALYLPNKPYIILYRPKVEKLKNYAHLIGHATMEDCVIGDCHGFSKFSNIDLSGLTATEEEKRLILTFLESGVYL